MAPIEKKKEKVGENAFHKKHSFSLSDKNRTSTNIRGSVG